MQELERNRNDDAKQQGVCIDLEAPLVFASSNSITEQCQQYDLVEQNPDFLFGGQCEAATRNESVIIGQTS